MQCFSSEKISTEHKEDCLVINGKQSVKLESGFISFKNYFKQLPVPFKIYADIERILEKVVGDIECISNSSHTRKHQIMLLTVLLIKYFVLIINLVKKIVLYRGKDAVYEFIKSILNEYNYCRKVIKKCFCRNLIMSAEEEERFEQSNICWICGKLFEISDRKVRYHCHISGKYRGASHWSCNINLKISKTIPVIFHNLKGYDSHLIFK